MDEQSREHLAAVETSLVVVEAEIARIRQRLARVRSDLSPAVVAPPKWLDVARAEVGTKETVGDKDSPRVLAYLATCEKLGQWARTQDETAWCSAFVNWCMEKAGVEGTNSAAARSWLGWGVEIPKPRIGCVAVLSRGADPRFGHVAFYAGEGGPGKIKLLGGNQHNAVRVDEYAAERVLSYRWAA